MSKVIQIVVGGVVTDAILVADGAVVATSGASVSWDSGRIEAPAGSRFADVEGAQIGWVAEGETLAPPPAPEDPPLPPLTRLAKADLWRRLTDPEIVALDAALQAAPLRLRRIYEAASYLDTTDEDYPALRVGIVGALGEARADEALSPTY